MTAVRTAPTPSTYQSGHCSVGAHDRCSGGYAGVQCTCPHHTEPPVLAAPTPPPAPARHCATCTCEDHR